MNFNQALITCLVLVAAISAAIEMQNPLCTPLPGESDDLETNFALYIDRTLAKPLLNRIIYLMKAISCEIRASKKINVIIMSSLSDQSVFSEERKMSNEISPFFYSVQSSEETDTDVCERFRRSLGRAPTAFLEHKHVEFIVPVVDDKSGCSMIETFQSFYKNSPLKDNLNFNGILINSNITASNNQSIRVVIPNIEKEIDVERESLNGSENINAVHGSANLVQSYAEMIRNILKGTNVRDWYINETTTTTQTTQLISSTTSLETSTLSVLQKAEEADDSMELVMAGGGEENTTTTVIVNSTTVPASTLPVNTTVFETTHVTTTSPFVNNTTPDTTTIGTTANKTTNVLISAIPLYKRAPIDSTTAGTTTDSDYDFIESNNPFELAQANTNLTSREDGGNSSEVVNTTTPRGTIDADLMMWLIIILLILWLICVILCLVWMFFCAKRKMDMIEDDADARQKQLEEKMPLLEKGPDPCSTKSVEGRVEEEDNEWKKIEPVDYSKTGASKSETESVHQPEPAVRYQPVEVSELEPNNDEEIEQKPRHGYLPAKKTVELQFD